MKRIAKWVFIFWSAVSLLEIGARLAGVPVLGKTAGGAKTGMGDDVERLLILWAVIACDPRAVWCV